VFCELIGKKIGMHREVDELFLLGLLSVMDALLNLYLRSVEWVTAALACDPAMPQLQLLES
jgi:c-di-GMP-related signal transduction protein